jgi:fatty-acyl-CoA synthase
VVVSGGENIATVEVEQALVSHDAVAEAAVIGMPDEKWGERPRAFVVLAPGQQPSQEEIIDHVRSRIAHYNAPDEAVFVDEVAKNSAGKVQKFQLREREDAKQARGSGGARRLAPSRRP